MIKIIPAILEEDFKEIEDKLSKVAGLVSSVQIDVCDGKFVPRSSWPFALNSGDFEKFKEEKRELPYLGEMDFEFDLMIKEPEKSVGDFVKIGASRIVVHLKSTDNFPQILKEWGDKVEVVAAISSSVAAEEIAALESLSGKLSAVQVMGIEKIGFQGQPFDECALDTISNLREKFPSLVISVDGGVSLETASRLVFAGANRLVAGSAVFSSSNTKKTIEELENAG
ncbi:MAG: hypothetical protein Q8P86_00055 [bacterium]|nr:hypothetical protein [bacterium]